MIDAQKNADDIASQKAAEELRKVSDDIKDKETRQSFREYFSPENLKRLVRPGEFYNIWRGLKKARPQI